MQFGKFQQFSKPNFDSGPISINYKFMKIGLYQKANMRIGKISSGAEYRVDAQFQNLPISGAKFRFSEF